MSTRRSLIVVALATCGVLAGCGTDSITVTASTVAGAVTTSSTPRSTIIATSTTIDSSPGSGPGSGPIDPTTVPGTATTVAPVTSVAKTIVLSATSLGVIDLGASKEDTVSAVSAVLGKPTSVIERQPSFSSFGTCPGTFVEAVSWGDLLLLFGDGDDGFAPGGVRHVYNWSLSTDAPDGPRTKLALANGVTLGSTVAEVEAIYRDKALVVEDDVVGPSFAVGGSPGIFGTTTGTADTDTVVYLEGGVTCGD